VTQKWMSIFAAVVIILLAIIALEGWFVVRWLNHMSGSDGWTIYPPLGQSNPP
jgi:hypothetical protein